MTSDGELRKKICNLQDKSWLSVKDCIRKYDRAGKMDRKFSPKKVDKMPNISKGSAQRAMERSKEKYRPWSRDSEKSRDREKNRDREKSKEERTKKC